MSIDRISIIQVVVCSEDNYRNVRDRMVVDNLDSSISLDIQTKQEN